METGETPIPRVGGREQIGKVFHEIVCAEHTCAAGAAYVWHPSYDLSTLHRQRLHDVLHDPISGHAFCFAFEVHDDSVAEGWEGD